MSDEPPVIPWYRSAVFVGAIVTIGSSILSLLAPKLMATMGLMDQAGVATASATLFQLITLGAGVFVAYKRKTSPLQPITLTQAAADSHPLTQIKSLGDPP